MVRTFKILFFPLSYDYLIYDSCIWGEITDPEISRNLATSSTSWIAMLTSTHCIGIALASERWPGVESALELYENLVTACLKAYDGNAETSYVISSPLNRFSQSSLHNVATPASLSSASTVASSTASHQAARTAHSLSPGSYDEVDRGSDHRTLSPASRSELTMPHSFRSDPYQKTTSCQNLFHYKTAIQETSFNPSSLYNTFPTVLPGLQHWDPGYAEGPRPVGNSAFYMPSQDEEFYLGTIGDQYSQYLHAPYIPHQPLQSLSQEEQIELMTNLEKTGLSEVNTMSHTMSRQPGQH